jgi:tetratricopeptide (TPR) repeat protein
VINTILMMLATATLAHGSWWRVAGGGFEVYTDASESAGVKVLERLREMQRIFQQQWPESRQPIRVLALRSEADYDAIKPGATARAFFQSGGERDYIVLLAGDPDTLRAACHEYVHAVVHHTTVALPRWLEEGLADFYSTAAVRRDQAHIGEPIAEHLSVLARLPWIDAGRLAAAGKESAEYNRPDRAGLFYAQSWALVHMLMLRPPWRDRMPQFLEKMVGGEPQETAFRGAFGKTMTEAVDELAGYLGQRKLQAGVLPLPAATTEAAHAERLSGPEGGLIAGEVALLGGLQSRAAEIYEKLAREFPDSPVAATGLATLRLQKDDYEGAKAMLTRALELGARDASTYLEYAMLLRDTGAPREQVRLYLERSVDANPQLAEAQFLLGLLDAAEKRLPEAIARYEAATRAAPRQSSFWHALAMTYWEAGKHGEARQAAQRAVDSAARPHEREAAQAALNLTSRDSRAAIIKKPAVVTPERWKPRQADHRLSGKLVLVECGEDGPRLHIEGTSEKVVLTAKRPTEIELRNAPSASLEFSCGPQNKSVIAGYTEDHDLVTLEFVP